MLNTELLKIIVFCFKLMTGSAGQVEMDVIQNYRHVATLAYVKESGAVTEIKQSSGRKFMDIKTIDNGLYRVKFMNNKDIKMDLAQWFMKLDWKKLTRQAQVIEKKGKPWMLISPGKNNVYIIMKQSNRIFVLPRKYFKN